MTDPLKLSDEIEAGSDVRVMAYDKRHRLLLATALRLAEAADDHDFPWWPRDMDGEPVRGATRGERVCPYCEQIRGDGHTRTCPVAAYRAARKRAAEAQGTLWTGPADPGTPEWTGPAKEE